MDKEFPQIDWDDVLADDCRQLVRLAVREDLGREHDWTTLATIAHDARGSAAIVSRAPGVVAGLRAAELALVEMNVDVEWTALSNDGQPIAGGTAIAQLSGSIRHLLTVERLLLNLIGRLTGIATLTSQYVQAIAGTGTKVYDTRKTTPGWRRLEKYAVRCGGGNNHRTGLFDAVLIKDNHIAFVSRIGNSRSPAETVRLARHFLAETFAADPPRANMIIEIEVDTLDQLREVLPASPDIVLLDNMPPDQLRQAVSIRDELKSKAELEASGGVNLQTVRAIAETGVERISIGALTHSAASLDVGLDWLDERDEGRRGTAS